LKIFYVYYVFVVCGAKKGLSKQEKEVLFF